MTIIETIPSYETHVGDAIVSVPDHVAVAFGEYADQGEPDILVRVVHAVNEEGDDISAEIAQKIARALDGTVGDYSEAWCELRGYVDRAVADNETFTATEVQALMREHDRAITAAGREVMASLGWKTDADA